MQTPQTRTRLQAIMALPSVVTRVILWALVALYTFMLPDAIIIYRDIVNAFGKGAAGKVPLVTVVLVGTAYALAVNGPILPPDLKNILLIPVAPHLSMDRAIVLARGSSVTVVAHTEHEAVISGDGTIEEPLLDGDRIVVEASPHVARFVRVQDPNYFYRTLTARMGQNPAANLAANPNQ